MKPFFCWGALIMTPIIGFMCDIRTVQNELNRRLNAKNHWESQNKTLYDYTKAIENYEDKIQEEQENKTKYEQQATETEASIKTPSEIKKEKREIDEKRLKAWNKYISKWNILWQKANNFLKDKNSLLTKIEKDICLTAKTQSQYQSQTNKIPELVTKILNIEFELEQKGFKVILCDPNRNSEYLSWETYKVSDQTKISAKKTYEEKNKEQNYDPMKNPSFYH